MTGSLTRAQWRTLDELLRDPEMEGGRFYREADYNEMAERAERYREALEKIAKEDYRGPLPESVRIARRALREPSTEWTPSLGEEVWLNYPDTKEPLGVVIGFVPDEVERRAGQPIIHKEGKEDSVIHPRFLLPFKLGGPDWQRAKAEGRIV